MVVLGGAGLVQLEKACADSVALAEGSSLVGLCGVASASRSREWCMGSPEVPHAGLGVLQGALGELGGWVWRFPPTHSPIA